MYTSSVGSNTQKLVFKQNTKYMLICGHLNTFPNTFWGDGIWYFKYQILFASLTLILLSRQNTINELLLLIKLFLICQFLSANFGLNVHY